MRSHSSRAPKRYLYGSGPAQEVEGPRAALGRELERVQDELIAQRLASERAVPALLVGGERVAPPEPVQHADDLALRAERPRRRDRDQPAARSAAMEGELLPAERSTVPALGMELEESVQQRPVDPRGVTHSNRTPWRRGAA